MPLCHIDDSFVAKFSVQWLSFDDEAEIESSLLEVIVSRGGTDICLELLMMNIVIQIFGDFDGMLERNLLLGVVEQRGGNERVHSNGLLLLLDLVQVSCQLERKIGSRVGLDVVLQIDGLSILHEHFSKFASSDRMNILHQVIKIDLFHFPTDHFVG